MVVMEIVGGCWWMGEEGMGDDGWGDGGGLGG